MTDSLLPCREAFEKWAAPQYYDLTLKTNGKYHNNSVQYAWVGWQAAFTSQDSCKIDLTNHHNAALCPYCTPSIPYSEQVEKVGNNIRDAYLKSTESDKMLTWHERSEQYAKAALAALGITEET